MTLTDFNDPEYSDSIAENYEKFFVSSISKPLAEKLMASAALRQGERILDVACGTGVVTRMAAERAGPGSVAGLDPHPEMLSVARAVTPDEMEIDWFETSVEAMPLSDASFDVVLCQMGLQFVSDKARAVQEICRVLRPGGRVVLNLPGPMPSIMSIYDEGLGKHIDPQSAGFINVVFGLHDPDALQALMSQGGFSEIDIEQTKETLRLPAPVDFLWQYSHSIPIAGAIANASEEARAAFQNDVSRRWQAYVVDGDLLLDLDMTTVIGTK